MMFPKMYEIATKDVVKVDCKICLKDAIEILKKSHHGNIIVTKDKKYYLFSADDLIKLKLSDSKLDKKLEDIPLVMIPQIDKDLSVIDAMELINSGTTMMCIVENDSSLFGIVTNADIISSMDPETLVQNLKIKDYIKKQTTIPFVDKNQTILEAISIMHNDATDFLIISDNNIPKGIFTSKDVILIISNNIGLNNKIDVFCSCPLQTIPENFTIKEAVDYVKKKHFKRIVAVDENRKITGIISQQDLISFSYGHWASMMKIYQDELIELNRILKEKSEKLQLLATTDMLTTLYNRYMFTELFNKFLENKKRDSENKLILALIDIDNFKLINDTYGHNIGDEVLKSISNLLLSNLRASDVCARWGGEEFVILLTNTDIQIGFTTIDKLRVAISTLNHSFEGKVTVSIGLTEISKNDTLLSGVKKADDALYKSKENGKNQVNIHISGETNEK